MLENRTRLLLILSQDLLDQARVIAGRATTALKLPVSLQIVLRALIWVGLKRESHSALLADIGIYRASGPMRIAGPTYEMTSYETKAECEAAQQAAMAKEALSRLGPTTERLSDGIKTWDSDRQHYTTFRYLCRLAGAGPTLFR